MYCLFFTSSCTKLLSAHRNALPLSQPELSFSPHHALPFRNHRALTASLTPRIVCLSFHHGLPLSHHHALSLPHHTSDIVHVLSHITILLPFSHHHALSLPHYAFQTMDALSHITVLLHLLHHHALHFSHH